MATVVEETAATEPQAPASAVALKAATALASPTTSGILSEEVNTIIEQAHGPIHVIDHSHHDPDCNKRGQWTWHTQYGGIIGTTRPITGFQHDRCTLYPVRTTSTYAFTWGQYRCVLPEDKRYMKHLRDHTLYGYSLIPS